MELPDNNTTGDRVATQNDAPAWPLYVRVLAVFYVFSYGAQCVAFLALALPAAFLAGLGRAPDGLILGLRLASALVFLFCWGFRHWFVRWGKRNYPTGKREGGTP